MKNNDLDGAIRLALFLIGIGFVFAVYQYLTTNPIMKSQITNVLTQTDPLIFGGLMVIFFIVYWKLNEQYKKK